MAKGQLHITKNGPKPCDAEDDSTCPYGGQHFTDPVAADQAYEHKMDTEFGLAQAVRKTSKSDPKSSGFGLESGGYYGEIPPRSVQIDALNDTTNALLEDGNTQLIAACGTGKSYMGRQLMRRMMDEEDSNGVAVVLTSSVKLAKDTAADLRPDENGFYDKSIGEYGSEYEVEVIEIHNESTAMKSNGAISMDKIRDSWKKALDENKRVVIVSTYQSSDKVRQVQEMIGDRAEADLLMNDEAHNILGQKKSVSSNDEALNTGYRSFANEIPGAIQSKHRLYATATPPLADSPDDPESSAQGSTREEQIAAINAQVEKMGGNGRERLTVYSDDEAIVGRVSGTITQQTAIENGYLTQPNYQLRSAVVSGAGDSADGYVDTRGRFTTRAEAAQGRQMTAQTYGAVNSTLQAMAADPQPDENGKLRNPTHNALAYTGSIEQAQAFRDNFRQVALEQSGGMDLKTAEAQKDSTDSEVRQAARMRLLAEHAEAAAAFSGTHREAKDGRKQAFSMFSGQAYTQDDNDNGWSPHKRVLSNVDIFSEGISINEIDTVVVSDQSKTSERAMTQAIGRSLRTVGGNESKNTGHVIIPRVEDDRGRELNGGFVTAASYGATRVERAVSTRKLKGESIPADNETKLHRYSSKGEAEGSALASDVARSHVNSTRSLIASQAIERADGALRSFNKNADPAKKFQVQVYRDASAHEKSAMQKSYIAEQAKKKGGASWAVAQEELKSVSPADTITVRKSGRVVTSALSAGDFSSVPSSVTDKLSRAGIVRTKEGRSSGPTLDEKRTLLKSNSRSVVQAFSSKGGREADPKFADSISKGVNVMEASKYSLTDGKRGSKADFDKLVSNYENHISSSPEATEKAYSHIEAARTDEKPKPASLSALLKQRGGISKDGLWSDQAALREKSAARSSTEAASGSADYELDPKMVSKNGTLKVAAQRKLAEVLDFD